MARRRYVSTTISQDTRVNKLAVKCGDFAALLYTWMIPHAADDATLPGDPEELLYQILPGRRDKSPEDVQAALDGMAALGLIEPTGDGRLMFPPVAFYKYQTYIKDRNKHGGEVAPQTPQPPPPSQPEQTDRANQRKSAQTTVSPSLTSSPSFSPSLSHSGETPPLPPTPPPPTPLRPVAAPPDRPAKEPPSFAAFWQAWPKKEARAAAVAAWRKVPQDDTTLDAILDAIPRQQAAKDWPRENWRYCPQPATWLNQRRWEDEVPDPLPKERTLVGKDRERLDVGTRVLEARRQRERNGFDGVVDQAGGALSHDAHGNGTRRLSR